MAEPVVRGPEAPAPVAATGDIDAALAARTTASATDLEAGRAQILAGWRAARGHHKRVFGEPTSQCRP